MSDIGRRDIELRIRAQDLSTSNFKTVAAAVLELAAAVDKEVASAKSGAISAAELRESMVKLEQAGKALTSISTLIDNHNKLSGIVNASAASVTKAAENLAVYRASLDATGTTTSAAERKLGSLVKQLELAEAAFNRNKASLGTTAAALGKAGIDTNDLAGAQANLKSVADAIGPSLTRLNEAHVAYARNVRVAKAESAALREEQVKQTAVLKEQKANWDSMQKSVAAFNAESKKLKADEMAAVRAQVNALRTSGGDATAPEGTMGGRVTRDSNKSLFGLRPYELQNLSYQINDIVSGLISGQRVTQIAAQQGGQVIQLFNKSIFDLVKYLPMIGIGAAAAAVAIGGLNSAFRDINAMREFTALIRSSADGANYSAPVLNKLQHEIRQMGISWDDTSKIMRQAIGTGLNQDRIKDFAQAARDIADIRPDKSVTEAFKDLTEGFSHGIEGIRKLNDQYHYFSAAELQQITNLYNDKKGVDGLNLAIDILESKVGRAAKGALSDMAKASRDLGTAWGNLTQTLGDTGLFQNFINGLTIIVNLLDRAVRVTPELAKATVNLAGSAIARFNTAIGNEEANKADAPDLYNPPGTKSTTGNNSFINRGLQIDTKELKQAVEVLTEAVTKAGLPEGYKVEAISAERPGAKIAGTNTPSEHSMGHAIDVRIVDATGKPIAGSMGTSGAKIDTTGMYAKLDAAFEETIKTKFPDSQYAIGTRFTRKSDPGHYSIGGQEADSQATREGRASPFATRQDEVANAQKAIDLAKTERQIRFDANEEQAKAAFERKARQEAEKEFPNDLDAQDKIVKLKMEERETERFNQAKDHQLQIRNLYISDGKNADAILAAGNAARQNYLDTAKNGLATLSEANKAELLGQEETRKKLAQEEHLRQQIKTIDNQLAQLDRANELKDTSNLENRLKGVSDKYTIIRNEAKKLAEETTNATTGGAAKDYLEKTLPKIDTSERAAKQLEEAKFRLENLNSLQQQRTDLITATNAAVAAGAMTASEGEDAIKAAFERTTPAINAAAGEFQKFLATADALDPTKIDLYTAKIKTFKAEATYISPLMKDIKAAVESSFSTGLNTAFNTVGEAIGGVIAKTKDWKDVISATKKAAADFFAQLLKDIAAAILKYEGLKLASSLGIGGDSKSGAGGLFDSLFGGSSSSGGGWVNGTGSGSGIFTNLSTGVTSDVAGSGFGGGGGIMSFLSNLFHEGGVVGRSSVPQRAVPASWFANAPRYHSGTVVGLAPDEQTAILKKGEEVLANDNPRNIMNKMGKGTPGDVSIRNVLVLDEDLIPGAMSGANGERTTMAHIQKNISTIRQLVAG